MDEAIKALLATGNKALITFTKRNLLGEETDIEELWSLSQVEKIIMKQQSNGSWLYPSNKAIIHSPTNYDQYQTYKTMAELVEFYGINEKHPAIKKATEYLFSFQTKAGEFRGIYGNQYSPNYSASITEFLIKAGCKDTRIKKSLDWLLQMRQDDGGWAIPFRTRDKELAALNEKVTFEPDRSKPFSHLITGIVLRPFSLIPEYAKKVKDTGILLADRVFTRDKYPDRVGIEFWTKFTFPYHWTDLLSTIDTLTLLGIYDHSKISEIRHWFENHRKDNGIYEVNVMAGTKYEGVKYWITLQYLTVLKRLKVQAIDSQD